MTPMLVYLDDGVAEILPAYLKAAKHIRMAVETGQFALSPTSSGRRACEFKLGHFSAFYSDEGIFTHQDRNQSCKSEEFLSFSGILPADGNIRRAALVAADRLVDLITFAQVQDRCFSTFGQSPDPVQALVDLHMAAAACAGLESIEFDIQLKNPFVPCSVNATTIRNFDDEFTLREDVLERFFRSIPPAVLLTQDNNQTLKLDTASLSFEIDLSPLEALRILSQLPVNEGETVLQPIRGGK